MHPDLQDCLDLISEIFSDTSVDSETTLETMRTIASVVEMNIAALEDDLA